MRTAIDISLYPLDANYIPPIKAFIDRLNTYPELQVTTNAMSTQIAGEHADRVPPEHPRRRGPAPFRPVVDDVVVEQRGRVD